MINPSAVIIIIGNEILSGRTLDTNTQAIAKEITAIGIDLKEVRVIPDHRETIISTILEVKDKYNYVFTTGGIGPTHDDITSESIAQAFNRKLILNDEAYNSIEEFYAKRGETLNEARKKMAYIPEGAGLISNPITGATGFIVDNVYVMAGVPEIMKAMLKEIIPTLHGGQRIESKSINIALGESIVAADFAKLQSKYPQVDMGSYPYEKEGRHHTSLVLRSNNKQALENAYLELAEILKHY